MPGAVGRTATFELTNATLPYVRHIAAAGLEQAAEDDVAIRRGINLYDGTLTCKGVADSLGLEYEPFEAGPS